MLNMKQVKNAVVLSMLAFAVNGAMAGECVLEITRTACPGMEKDSFIKCDGKASCKETVPAASPAQCTLKAKAGCANKRLEITKYKKVSAVYDGAPVEGGKDYCVGHPDFPFAAKANCK